MISFLYLAAGIHQVTGIFIDPFTTLVSLTSSLMRAKNTCLFQILTTWELLWMLISF